jgi:hypothetical protein
MWDSHERVSDQYVKKDVYPLIINPCKGEIYKESIRVGTTSFYLYKLTVTKTPKTRNDKYFYLDGS